MTENEKQNEVDAEQALKDFLKDMVLLPLEAQQKNFLTPLRSTVQNSILENRDILETKYIVDKLKVSSEITSSNVDLILQKIVEIYTKQDNQHQNFNQFVSSAGKESKEIVTKIDNNTLQLDELIKKNTDLSIRIGEYEKEYVKNISGLQTHIDKKTDEFIGRSNKSFEELKKNIATECGDISAKVEQRFSNFSNDNSINYKQTLFFRIAITFLLMLIIILQIFK